MSDDQGVLEGELAEELGFSRAQMRKMRESHLNSNDWGKLKQGKGRPKIVIYPEGERKLRLVRECGNSEPQVVPFFQEATITHVMPNPKFVRIQVEGEDLPQLCLVPIGLQKTWHRGKRIRVEVVTDPSGTSYRHERLAAIKG